MRGLIPLALCDSTLLKAVLALSARHKANIGHSFYHPDVGMPVESGELHQEALLFKVQAIQGLSSDLGKANMYRNDTTVATIFLLIFLDLLESGSDRWNVHIEGAKRLIRSIQLPSESPTGTSQDPGRTLREIRNFISSQIHLYVTYAL